jgi:hypothetical protein
MKTQKMPVGRPAKLNRVEYTTIGLRVEDYKRLKEFHTMKQADTIRFLLDFYDLMGGG